MSIFIIFPRIFYIGVLGQKRFVIVLFKFKIYNKKYVFLSIIIKMFLINKFYFDFKYTVIYNVNTQWIYKNQI